MVKFQKGFVIKLSVFFLSVVVLFFAVEQTKKKVNLKEKAQEQSGVSVNALGITIGEEEYVFGPMNADEGFDAPFFTVPATNGIRAYSQTANTYSYFGQSLETLHKEGLALGKGTGSNFDNGGAWLYSTYKLDGNHWLGWYHAEGGNSAGGVRTSIAFAESFDAGKTWIKPQYPNNEVITPDTAYLGNDNTDDTGGGKVLKIGDYFFMYFLSTSDWKIHLARSKVGNEGRPGTWEKYYNGNFTEPGIGGKSTPTDASSVFVVYNSYIDEYISILVSGRWGFHLSITEGKDLSLWKKFPFLAPEGKTVYPLVSYTNDDRVDSWLPYFDGRENKKQIYGYPSFIAPNGDSDNTGKEFYLYYMKLFDKGNFNQRYLLRRKITLDKNAADSYFSKVELTRYEKQNPREIKVSTEISKPSESYSKTGTLGYLLTYSEVGFQPLYECFIPVSGDYMVSTADLSLRNWEHCESNTDIFIRNIGWISKIRTQNADTPLYRCFDEQNSDHFMSLDPNCEGKRMEELSGFLIKYQATITPTPSNLLPFSITLTGPAQATLGQTVNYTAASGNSLPMANISMHYAPKSVVDNLLPDNDYKVNQPWKLFASCTSFSTCPGILPADLTPGDYYITANAKTTDNRNCSGNPVCRVWGADNKQSAPLGCWGFEDCGSSDNKILTLSSSGSPTPVSGPALSVSKIIVKTGHRYSVVPAANNIKYYSDRDYTFTGFPDQLAGSTLIKTANDDKKETTGDLLKFNINVRADVYVAYDKRSVVLPSWLRVFQDTGLRISIDDGSASPLRVYKKTFSPGTVTLGGNWASGADKKAKSNYVVIVKKK